MLRARKLQKEVSDISLHLLLKRGIMENVFNFTELECEAGISTQFNYDALPNRYLFFFVPYLILIDQTNFQMTQIQERRIILTPTQLHLRRSANVLMSVLQLNQVISLLNVHFSV